MSEKPKRLADGAELDAFVTEHDVALVEFYTAGCSKCGAMVPVLGLVSRVADVAVGLVNPGDDLELVERFSIHSVPTLVVFRDGKPVATKADGFVETEAVLAWLAEYASERVPE